MGAVNLRFETAADFNNSQNSRRKSKITDSQLLPFI